MACPYVEPERSIKIGKLVEPRINLPFADLLFLATYLQQIVTVGYDRAPLEVDARTHERDA
jgi:hypothetical protein